MGEYGFEVIEPEVRKARPGRRPTSQTDIEPGSPQNLGNSN